MRKIDPKPLKILDIEKESEKDFNTNYIFVDRMELDKLYKVRALSQLQFRVGHLFLHAAILLSYIYRIDTEP